MARIRTAAILAIAFASLGIAQAVAQIGAAAPRIFRSGNGYHVAACPGPVPAGHARCFALIATDRTGRPMVNRLVPNRGERTARSNVVPAGYGPNALISAYNPAVAATYPAVGQSTTIIAIVDAFGYTNAGRDLSIYRATYGLPPCTNANGCFTKFNQRGAIKSYPAQNDGWAVETALDLDMASAMCPGCKIILVEADDNSNANLAQAVRTAVFKGAHVVSNSYGAPEQGPGIDQTAAYDHPGVAITVSTGDDGYDNQDSFPQGVQFPSTAPGVIAVGGTTLLQANNARGWTEFAWSRAGSGCSQFYPKPTWQKDKLCTTRMTADISAVADPSAPVAVYAPVSGTTSGWQAFGGTSVAAPVIGGLFGANGGKVVAGSVYTVPVNDVVAGSNGSCAGTYFCNARTGFDGPTGRGTPKGEAGF